VDAQLPYRLVGHLVAAGHQAIHTRDLPSGNRTTDDRIATIAATEDAVVVTKDADFVTSHFLTGKPQRLLQISTGNLPNDLLFRLMSSNLPAIVAAFEMYCFVELSTTRLTIHH
jgi:predicted nuclease of predicted toxin-antitoxin system